MDKDAARILNRMIWWQRLRTTTRASFILLAVGGMLVFAVFHFSPDSTEPAKGIVHSWTLAQSGSGTAP